MVVRLRWVRGNLDEWETRLCSPNLDLATVCTFADSTFFFYVFGIKPPDLYPAYRTVQSYTDRPYTPLRAFTRLSAGYKSGGKRRSTWKART